MDDDARLFVDGRGYGGWKSVRITRSIESIAGSFDLDVSDRWGGQEEPWPIAEEDSCRVKIGDQVVIDGYVDKRSLSIAADSRTLGYSGRDRSASLVDSSALLDRWSFRNATVEDVARQVAEPFGIPVSVQAGLVLPRTPKIVVNPGDTAFHVIEEAAAWAGVLLVSDGAGGIVITRAGAGRATPLVQGENVLAASVEYDGSGRFHRYEVATQIGGTDNASGKATRIKAEAIDEGVRRTERVLLVRPEKGLTTEFARRRADWEARIRAAKAETVNVTVLGWLQDSGQLWPLNAVCHVEIPAIGVDGDMLISQAEHGIDGSGKMTTLRLVRPDAFTPEPQHAKVKKSGERWNELAKGA